MTAQFVQPGSAIRVEVYVPSTRFDEPISDTKFARYVEVVETRLADLFGGSTSIPATGSYISEETQELIREPVTVVYSFTRAISPHERGEIIMLARWLAEELSQEAVLVVIGDKYYFIS